MSKIAKIILISVLSLIVLYIAGIFWGIRVISKKIDQPTSYIPSLISQIKSDNPYSNKDKINFIILGLDKRDDSLEKTQTTDTIMFASLNLKDYKINTISIPRDLWFYDINAKANEIYPLSLDQPNQFSFIKEKFQKLTGQNIDHVVILTTDNLISFVDLIGGVDLTLEQGFIDKQYPNPEYIKDPKSGAPIYKTVEFKSGQIHLDKSNITEFVRSRKGGETVAQGGTDLARIKRQQQLLEAILAKVKSGDFIKNFSQVFDLYKFWNKDISKDITDLQSLQIASVLGENITKLNFNKIEIKVGTTAKNGLIYHPIKFINKQWVFIPSDKDYKSFHQFFSDSI